MEPIRPITALPPSAAVDAPRPIDRAAGTERKPLDPAVSIALSTDAASGSRTDTTAEPDRRGFERDAETKAVVFRISDAVSGEVVLQIPNEVVLKARVYARQPNPPSGERVARSA